MTKLYHKEFLSESKLPSQIISWKRRLGLVIFVLGVIFSTALLTFFWFSDTPILSPITNSTTFRFFSDSLSLHPTSPKVVYGFLPYWNINKTSLHPELTHLGYFGLLIGSDGNFVTSTADGTEPGYAKLKSDLFLQLSGQARKKDVKVELVLIQFDNDDIVSLLKSKSAQENLLKSLDSALLAYPIKGVNIDIEYTGQITPSLRDSYTQLVQNVRTHLNQKYADITLSIDVYSSAAENNNLWDLEKLAPNLDYVVVMAYDFHRRTSPLAGPVAPLFGGKSLWDSDISNHLQQLVKMVPREKILLGVPFYGYEWETTSDAAQAHTIPNTGVTASYERVQEVLAKKEELKVEEHWNDYALSPYLTYTVDGKDHVLYFDNSRSLSYKLDFVNQLDLGGIAIWALGYEGDYQELWDIIARKLL